MGAIVNLEIRRVVAALDDSDAATAVAAVTRAIATVLGTPAHAIHIRENGGRTARAVAESAQLPYEVHEGNVVDLLVGRARVGDLIVLGSQDRPRPGIPFGHIARQVMTRCDTPIVIVPPNPIRVEAEPVLLIPLDGTVDSAPTLHAVCEIFHDARCDVVTLYVFEDETLPPFGDHTQYETEAWLSEFVARHCESAPDVHVEVRVGNPIDHVLAVADDHHASYIVVGWKRRLEPGHARVLQGLLERSHVPFVLVPLH